jgi:IclR family transcriptional regulator, positive regulator for flagellar biogenesis
MTAGAQRRPPRRGNSAETGKVSALQRGLDVLACFETQNHAAGHAELARATGIPKPTLSRMLGTLAAAGFLRFDDESEKYSLGPRVVALANAYVNSFDVRALARPLMHELAQQTGASAYLAIASDLDMLIIEVARSQKGMLLTRLDIGSRVPMSTSALGRAYLQHVGADERGPLLGRMALTHGEHWAAIWKNMQASFRKAKRLGYNLSLGEIYPDIHSIATAMTTPTGDTVVLNCGGPSMYMTSQIIEQLVGPALIATAHKLRRAIGSPAPPRDKPDPGTPRCGPSRLQLASSSESGVSVKLSPGARSKRTSPPIQ